MPSRSVSFWSIAGVSLSLAAALSGPRAFATITVTPVRQDGTEIKNRVGTTGTTFYYPMGTLTSGFLDPGDSPSQTNPILAPATVLSQTGNETEVTTASTSAPNAIFLKVSSDKALTAASGSGLAVTVKFGSLYVPIGVVSTGSSISGCGLGLTACYPNVVQVGSNTQYNTDAAGGTNYYRYAVPYTSGSPVYIGLYPADICNSLALTGGQTTTNICSGNALASPAGTNSAMALSINIESVPGASTTSGASAVLLGGNGTVTTTAADSAVNISLVFESSGPSATCPSMTDIYKPGDQTIFLNTTAFTATTGTNAPVTSMIVIAKDSSAALDFTSTFGTSGTNDVVRRIPTGDGAQAVTGFTNTSSSLTDHNYVVGFFVRDAAGVAVMPTNANGSNCTVGSPTVGVQTASISGFLKKSSCFIATAAYRSGDAGPVVMLRQFRDQILLHHAWGRTFTSWYYGWSPPAAEWLMDHPVFRFPVLVALIPLELIAWGSLHPSIIAAIFLCAALGFFATHASRRDVR